MLMVVEMDMGMGVGMWAEGFSKSVIGMKSTHLG